MSIRRCGTRRLVLAAVMTVLALSGAGCGASTTAVPAGPATGGAAAAGGPAVGPSVTAAELRDGLLGSEEATAGFVAVSGAADEGGGRAVFEGAGCAELARLLNVERLPGSRAEAAVALSSGPEGAAAAEQLYAMESPQLAAQVVDRYHRAAEGCTEITLSVAGAGTSTSAVRPISLVEMGDASSATEMSSESPESFADQAVVQVVAHSGSVVVAVTVMGGSADDAETVARAAVDKVRRTIAG